MKKLVISKNLGLDNKKLSIGVDSNQNHIQPGSVLTSMLKKYWTPLINIKNINNPHIIISINLIPGLFWTGILGILGTLLSIWLNTKK